MHLNGLGGFFFFWKRELRAKAGLGTLPGGTISRYLVTAETSWPSFKAPNFGLLIFASKQTDY